MKRVISQVSILTCMILILTVGTSAVAEEALRYSCSYQVYDAVDKGRIEAFTQETGIKMEIFTSSSGSAVYRLMNDFSDIASSTRGLYYRHKESGYTEIPFCLDPLAVICNSINPVSNLTSTQIEGIFHKTITNWEEVGGPDQPIVIVIPGKNTAAFKNFDRIAMRHREILYDYMSYHSTAIIQAVKNFPYAISFISQGAALHQEKIKILKVDGIHTNDNNYPYHQTFYYITKGQPSGLTKKFIDFTMSPMGQKLIKAKGMVPIKK